MPSHLFAELTRLAQSQPDAVALRDTHGTVHWGELPAAVDALALRLREHGGERLALLADNSRHWVLADLAALKLGRVLVPVPLFFSDTQRRHLLERAGIDTLITCAQDQLQLQRLSNPVTDLHAGTAKITFTSGTTGTPKGVCLSADQQLNVARSLTTQLAPLAIRRHLCLLPLATLLENIAGVYTALLMGACIELPALPSLGWQGSSGLDSQCLLGALHQHQPDSLITLPQVLSALTRAAEQGAALPMVKFIAVGGARVGAELIRRARASGLPAYEGYGLSECASVVSLNTPAQDCIGSAGTPLAHNSLSVSAAGELLIDGNRMLGYLGEPAPTGPYATGDLVRLDDDGFVHVEGRMRNVIINSFGRNISPEWVESELLSQPGIEQAVLFGEARPFNTALIHAPTLDDAALQRSITQVNTRLPDYARALRWVRVPNAMSSDEGLFTLNGRPRRDAIATRFAEHFESVYQLDH
ncbi:AMP-binding protein [Marinobacterium iners]|uniref:Long-chain acyl-CoA synthetase (AMP-forming) n=1 Tax=Marinobacterium iners DSM 11526 TaxID=1122198 RepID=A0A1H3XAK9_9GAMM|nr:AMP-binding protein [Marinobacterium iners]SDZ96427.1 Long-chain acyl-CoA synthetase (AMP-forming) [Marinobacterium iners DSM 11526]